MNLLLGIGGGRHSSSPSNSVAPAITGTTEEGQTLTASTGTWSNTPTSYTYQWKRNGTPIGGATSSTYVLQFADIQTTITVTVTATNTSGSGSATSGSAGTITPAEPDLITTMTVGIPSGQIPNVHVRDITNGFELYARNADTIFNNAASCCKLMTVLLAYEYHQSDWTSGNVTMNATDVSQPIAGLTLDMTGFQSGDVISWEEAVYGVLLPSSTECCRVIARTIGNELYAAAGNTGTQGEARFVERMNSRAAELGLTNTTFENPYGGSASGATVRNRISARDLSTLCVETLSHAALRTIAGTPTYDITVTGGRTATVTATGFNRFTNGPTSAQAGVKDPNEIGGKNGVWTVPDDGVSAFSLTHIWTTPAGYEVVITTLNSYTLVALMLDQRGLIFQLYKDFPYLLGNTTVGTDASFSSVKILVGADGSIADESSVVRTITNDSVTVGTGFIAGSTGAAAFNAITDSLFAADAADLQLGAGDGTCELWYSGDTTGQNNSENVFFCKADGGQREWLINDFNGQFQVFASSDLANWNNTVCISMSAQERATFYNGAPRHIAMVRASGLVWLYLNGERYTNNIAITTTPNGTAPVIIGYPSADVAAPGRYDDWRYTVGVARYTSAMVSLNGRKFPRS